MRLKARDRPGDLVAGLHLRHAHGQIAAAHTFGRMDQPSDRPRDLVGQHQADQHGRQQHQQRDDGEDPGEGDLQPGAVIVEPLVFGDRLFRARHVLEDLRIDRPADHQHQRRRRIEPRPPPAPACRRRRPARPHRRSAPASVTAAGGSSTSHAGEQSGRGQHLAASSGRRSPPRSARAAWSARRAPRRTPRDRR